MPDSLSEIDGILHALGEMNAAWGHYEDAVFMLLGDALCGSANVWAAYAIRSELDIKTAAAILKNLALLSGEMATKDHVLQLVSWTNRPLREARNRYVHDPLYAAWSRERQGTGLERHYYRTRLKKEQSFKEAKASALEVVPVSRELLKSFTAAIRSCEAYCGSIIHHWSNYEPAPLSFVEASRERAATAIASYIDLAKSLDVK